MKTKKTIGKPLRKTKSAKEFSDNRGGIRKAAKVNNIKRVKNNDVIFDSLKADLREKDVIQKPIPNRQLVWNAYLRTFNEIEKLNKKQKQIMDFCTNKSRTPPKRKRKFLNFIRHSFPNQADVTDEQVNELFDTLLKKYEEFKTGTYSVAVKANRSCEDESTTTTTTTTTTTIKLSVNKKKKLKRAATKCLPSNSNTVTDENDSHEGIKSKKRRKKRARTFEMDVEEQNDG